MNSKTMHTISFFLLLMGSRGLLQRICASVWDWRIFQRHYGDWTKMKRLPSAILTVIQGLESPTK